MKRYFLIFFLFGQTAFAQTFTLKSNSVGGQATLNEFFNGMGCKGSNISPQLSWDNAPESTKSFAVTMYDPDAPTGSGFWHWIMFDIPANTKELIADAGNAGLKPVGSIQSITDYGKSGYGGPCPPAGDRPHRYVITVYALKVSKLGLDKDAMPAIVGFFLNANAIEKASIIMYAER